MKSRITTEVRDPDGNMFLCVVATRGRWLRSDSYGTSGIGPLLFTLIVGTLVEAVGPLFSKRKVAVFEIRRGTPRKRYKTTVAGPESATELCAELRAEIERGIFRWFAS